MDSASHQNNIPLRQQSSTLSDYSIGSNSTFVASPTSPSVRRPGYHRVPSVVDEGAVPSVDSVLHSPTDSGDGLGIANLHSQKRSSVSRVPVGSKTSPSSPGSADPLLSPASAKPAYKPFDGEPPYERDEQDPSHDPTTSHPYQPFTVESERERLHRKTPSAFADKDLLCKSKKPLGTGRGNWLAISILILSIYSTCFSGSWLFIAIMKPRYGRTITTAGSISPQTASILCTAFAKTIELSFVTVFVALIGQILSKRALGDRKSITIAEMSMRSWILQPGTMLAHWESVRYAAVTYLGVIALIAALMAMIYTTASDALVAPKLKMGKLEDRVLFGRVATKFANSKIIMNRCTTPIQQANDPDNYGQTCIELEHSGEAYHNYMQYLGIWVEDIDNGTASTDMSMRPPPVGMLYDNTTVKGTWTGTPNMTELSNKWNRIVNNVTMVMPHSGIVAASRDPLNGIMQPQDLSGLGEYYIQASVPSPMVNVLCAEMTETELAPMVYTNWSTSKGVIPNTTSWPNDFNLTLASPSKTAVDDLFGFNNEQVYPIFPKLPVQYNTIFNATNFYGANAVYLLATSSAGDHTLCSIRTTLSPNCSTEYHATGSGGSLDVNCDPKNRLAYSRFNPLAPSGIWNKDWKDVASEWGSALSLGAGISDGKASNARLLTQLIPTSRILQTSTPSISEALAILAGNTLLLSALDSPFIHYWNYSETVPFLKDPQYQALKATLKVRSYQSGGTQDWQRIFYIVLLLVFIANLFCLSYFIASGNLVTDFVEPQNLFCLSLLSPPSEALEGACAGGPVKGHYSSKFNIKIDKSREHVWFESSEKKRGLSHKHNWSGSTEYELEANPVARMYSRIRKKRSSML